MTAEGGVWGMTLGGCAKTLRRFDYVSSEVLVEVLVLLWKQVLVSVNKGFEWSLYVLGILDLLITKEFQESLFMLKVLDFLTRWFREFVHVKDIVFIYH